jgi:hypothetical protein
MAKGPPVDDDRIGSSDPPPVPEHSDPSPDLTSLPTEAILPSLIITKSDQNSKEVNSRVFKFLYLFFIIFLGIMVFKCTLMKKQ